MRDRPFGREDAHRSLKRLLANGPLTAMPRKPADQRLLALLAASRFEPGKPHSEAEVNERLVSWLCTFSAPCGIDHVSLRRLLVDSRLLARTASGSTYERHVEERDEAQLVADVDPEAVLTAARGERESRRLAAERTQPRE